MQWTIWCHLKRITHCAAGPTKVQLVALLPQVCPIFLKDGATLSIGNKRDGYSRAEWVPQPQSWELPKSCPLHSECPWLLHSRTGLEAARWALQYSESKVLLVFLCSQAVNGKLTSSVASAVTHLISFICLILGHSRNDASV